MRRIVVLLAVVGLVSGLAGVTPAPAGAPACQVTATVNARSCSFIATSKSVNAIIIGTGNVSFYDSLGFRAAYYCPLSGARCLGAPSPKGFVKPGYRVKLTMNIGFGRVQTGLP